MKTRTLTTLAAAAAATLALAGSAHATVTYTVTDNGDATNTCSGPTSTTCTLRSALESAIDNADTTAVINLASKTFTLTQGPLFVNAGGQILTINGAADGGTKIDGGGDDYLLNLDDDTTTTLNGLTLQNAKNTGGVGGAVYSGGGNLTVRGSTITNNQVAITGDTTADAAYTGGAIAIDAGATNTNPKLDIQNSTISGNKVTTEHAPAVGGGIDAGPGHVSVTVSQSLISGNSASSGTTGSSGAGGIHVGGTSTLAMDNSTVTGNSAEVGGGLGFDGTASSTISQSTVAGNTGAGIGFRGDNDPGTTTDKVSVDRSIVAGTTPCATDRGGTIVDGGYNLDSGSSCAFSNATSKSNTDAKLSGLRSTFFVGQQVLVPLPGSPAIDGAGATCPTGIDARLTGPNRPVDGNLDGTKACDIGAVEFIPATRKVNEGAPTQTTEVISADVTNGDAPVKVRVAYGPGTDNYPNSVDLDVPYDKATATVTATLTGLTPGSTYHYRVELLDGAVTSPGGEGTFFTKRFPSVAIDDATGVTETAATLNGRLAGYNLPGVGYHFEYGLTTTYGSATPNQDAAANSNTVPVTAALAGLTGGKTYHYRLVATYGSQSFPSSDRTFDTTDPPVLVATRSSLKKLKLKTATTYKVSIFCSLDCSLAGKLTTTKKLAKKLKLKTTIFKAGGKVKGGTKATLTFKLSKKVRKRLRAKKVKSLKLVVVATPTSGAPFTVTGKVKLG